MLELNKVNTFYGQSHVLHDISFSVSKGEIFTVLGRNGVGKTTLLKCIMGLTDSSHGKILFNTQEFIDKPTHERAREGIAYVPQGRDIVADFSVRENIMMGTYALTEKKNKIPDLVGELFPYLTENLDRSGGLLSGGQQQQLAIARALAAEPALLLLDEPTEGIQPNIVAQIEETIQRLNSELGLTIILVEQNVKFAKTAAQHYAMLEKGTVVESGSIESLTDEVIRKHMVI